MPPKQRKRTKPLTVPKKHDLAKRTTMSDAEFESMLHGFRYIDHDNHIFEEGACIRLNADANDEWLAKILAMRSHNADSTSADSWARIQWFYSPGDIHNIIDDRSIFDPDDYMENERFFSDHIQYQKILTFLEPAVVHPVVDDIANPPLIDENSFFSRFTIHNIGDEKKREFKPPLTSIKCWCGTSYKPYSSEIELPEGTPTSEIEKLAGYMRLCPRPGCKWWHETCVAREPSEMDEWIGSPGLRRLAMGTDGRNVHPLLQRYIRKCNDQGKDSLVELPRPSVVDDIKHVMGLSPEDELPIPSSVIEVAAMPLLRRVGTDIEGFERDGNVADVKLARMMVWEMLSWPNFAEGLLKTRKLSRCDWVEDEALFEKIWLALGEHRLLASPLPRYWDAVKTEMERIHGSRPGCHCPNCFIGKSMLRVCI